MSLGIEVRFNVWNYWELGLLHYLRSYYSLSFLFIQVHVTYTKLGRQIIRKWFPPKLQWTGYARDSLRLLTIHVDAIRTRLTRSVSYQLYWKITLKIRPKRSFFPLYSFLPDSFWVTRWSNLGPACCLTFQCVGSDLTPNHSKCLAKIYIVINLLRKLIFPLVVAIHSSLA